MSGIQGIMNFDICVYHSPCSDGLASAWIVKRISPTTDLFPYKFQSLIDDQTITLLTGKTVLFADCAPKLIELELLQKTCTYILVLDHYKTNKDILYSSLNTSVEFIYKENLSGCQIVWEYFHKDTPTPWFINYIAD